MAWFEDLAECSYFPVSGAALRAVGWLERGKPVPVGIVEKGVYAALKQLAADPWQPLAAAGGHECDLCAYEPGASGSANLFIPGRGVLYVAPAMIIHYMNAHQYQPPDVFCGAVLRCPQMRTMDYLKAVLENGGRSLVQWQRGRTRG